MSIEDKINFEAGNSIEIKINASGSKKLTLYPAKDGIKIAKAVVTWHEPDKDLGKGYLIYKESYVENSVTVDNISGEGNLIVTPKQYYVPYKTARTIPYKMPHGFPKGSAYAF
jgi:hypothetical protein